jgi:hypothetical protein
MPLFGSSVQYWTKSSARTPSKTRKVNAVCSRWNAAIYWAQMQILVADDHEVVRKGVCAILASHFQDSECIEASNGQDASSKSLQSKDELETLLSARCILQNTQRRAKNELRHASKRPRHLLDELIPHRKKHGYEQSNCRTSGLQFLLVR